MEPSKPSGGLFEDEDDLFTPALEDPLTSKLARANDTVDLIGGIGDQLSVHDDEDDMVERLRLEDDSLKPGQHWDGQRKTTISDDGVNGDLERGRLETCSLTDVDMESNDAPLAGKLDSPPEESAQLQDQDDGDDDEQHRIGIDIEKFERRGEGVAAYVAYMVVCKIPASVPGFSKREYVTWRRFSDFLGLHDALCHKYLVYGRIVPPAPPKNVIGDIAGMTKAKMIKGTIEEDPVTSDFVERRRASLERYLRRTAAHPVLQADPYFRTFVTLEDDLPRASQTAVLSSNTIKRIWDRVSDGLNKYAVSKMDANDAWFNERQYEVDQLDVELHKLLGRAETLVTVRRDYAATTDQFCKCLSVLTACEENTSLSRALSLLCETMEKISQLQSDQSDKDFYVLFETLRDYMALVDVVKEVFHERTKTWNSWQSALQTLAKKRDNKSRFETAGKTERVPQALKEVEEWEQKSTEAEKHFASISRIIQKEYSRFEQQRIKEFKNMLIYELESIANTQQQLTKLWEAFIPDAQAIL